MKKVPQNGPFFSISENPKFWSFSGSFSPIKIYKHMETDKFLGTMLLDLSGTYFVFINYSILFFLLASAKKILLCIGAQNIA